MRVELLHGTETGTAELVCEDMEAAVSDRADTSVKSMEDVDPTALDGDTLYVFVCSTFGRGDLPTTAEGFHTALTGKKPDLSHVRFAIFGLGDKTFGETFAQGSEKLMDAMKACGATMIGDRGIADAASVDLPEDVAVPWLEGILEKAAETA
ncbi:MAG: flavodoxin domain-containing protein [Pseudomonadota bacterium]